MKPYCQVCFGPLKPTDKRLICSDACRAKKSRNKRNATKKAYDMGFTIDGWAKLLNDGAIDTGHAKELLDAVWDRLHNFYELIQEHEARARARAEIEEKSNKRRK